MIEFIKRHWNAKRTEEARDYYLRSCGRLHETIAKQELENEQLKGENSRLKVKTGKLTDENAELRRESLTGKVLK